MREYKSGFTQHHFFSKFTFVKSGAGFISIERLILIVLICLLILTGLAAFFSARAQAFDKQKITDITAIQNVLHIYFNENGFYPYGQSVPEPSGITNYLDHWPTPPLASGSCTKIQNQYIYSQKSNGEDFNLSFCLGQKTGGLSAGLHTLTSKGIQ